MKIFSRPVCGIVLAASGVLTAQQGNLSGPVAGFVFDGSGRAMRPIQGIPGAVSVSTWRRRTSRLARIRHS
jgi:hypothetical protein